MDEELCPWGCLFDNIGRLEGDCRMPETDECECNRRRQEAQDTAAAGGDEL